MLHIMRKIADWLIENEKKEALDCSTNMTETMTRQSFHAGAAHE